MGATSDTQRKREDLVRTGTVLATSQVGVMMAGEIRNARAGIGSWAGEGRRVHHDVKKLRCSLYTCRRDNILMDPRPFKAIGGDSAMRIAPRTDPTREMRGDVAINDAGGAGAGWSHGALGRDTGIM